MTVIHKVSIALLIASSGLFAQAPAPNAVWNPASYIPPGFPNSGIAQGSVFVVYGTNLGPPSIAQASLPLPNTVGGTSITVTVPAIGGTTVNAPMVYSLAGQVVGVLPSNTPIGTGTLTVSFNGKSGSMPIQVVQSNFGILTIDETGVGPAVVTFTDYSVVTPTKSAKPGDTLFLWGTGLGPLPAGGNDAAADEVAIPANAVVYVGGVQATTEYIGRSADPGLDQIVFVVPAGVSGCYTSLVVQTGSTVSNDTSMSVSPNGGACSDADGVPLSTLSSAIGKNSISIGGVTLIEESLTLNEFGSTISSNDFSASASFNRFTAAQLATTTSLNGLPSVGSCTDATFTGAATPPPAIAATALGLNAGAAITVTPPTGSPFNLTESNGVTGSYTNLKVTALPTGAYSISGTGGADVGPFTVQLNVPPPLVWTNETAITICATTNSGLPGTVVRANPLKITWTGGDPNGFALILGAGTTGSGEVTSLGGGLYCVAPIAPGSSHDTRASAAPTAAYPRHQRVGPSFGRFDVRSPVTFQATGIDYGFATVGFLAGANLASTSEVSTSSATDENDVSSFSSVIRAHEGLE